MKLLSLLSVGAVSTSILAGSAMAQQLSGAGASFPAPLYQRWASEYNKVNPAVQVNYQSVGSGAGVKQFGQGTVDFAASDAAMSDEEIAKVKAGVVMIPATAGSIVIAYNLPGVTDLKLSREAYAGIFLGKVTKWNDPIIVKDNPGVTLPNLPINVAYRSDGSGTTFVFTKHLAAISKDFADTVGSDKSVQWPVGVGGKGNEGVTALIKQSPAPWDMWSTATPSTTASPPPSCRTRLATSSRPPMRAAQPPWPASSSRRTSASGPKTRLARRITRSRPSPGCSSTSSTRMRAS